MNITKCQVTHALDYAYVVAVGINNLKILYVVQYKLKFFMHKKLFN